MARIEAGPFEMGDPGRWFAYDNERPRHERDLPARYAGHRDVPRAIAALRRRAAFLSTRPWSFRAIVCHQAS